jgi:hypothetical protein
VYKPQDEENFLDLKSEEIKQLAPKVSDHFYATRVILWTKLAFYIAFYTFNF